MFFIFSPPFTTDWARHCPICGAPVSNFPLTGAISENCQGEKSRYIRHLKKGKIKDYLHTPLPQYSIYYNVVKGIPKFFGFALRKLRADPKIFVSLP
jgi:predicted nucleic acid-binding Zn ribbon protein